ncbi:tRNA (adenosine(37)-N6)-dimethylallyltransferase MiaA [Sphingomonas sp.]|uniref:tRNA (adenosine(37)-N6)-dimethylallyltransferase MiaA n=1 Tax=Sphingomonas sp. TaxID=28214 RepID=UPI001E0E8378|nr:tRNA (adenosine(37)-N6)-dimethylallyltransferase MiaA [Sphingomonas sp.]MBX9796427.1 tRNA (adenosine(37)-N6)-dimethylallyltransferase MiaA [Sphingomonas sp.]
MNMASLPRLALIAGPTASGKSALAMALAESANGVVINADATQAYADLRILSARPTQADEARVPHRLFGYLPADEAGSAARWAAAARGEIAAAHAAGQLPILVGGTGLYLRTLLDGIAPVPDIDPAVRAAVRAMPVAQAHDALVRLDPAGATRLNPADTSRVARALEVVRSTGRPLAEWQAAREGGIADRVALRPLILLPDRATLMARCDARLATMFDGGAVEEVRALLARPGLNPDAPVLRAIGVPEIAGWLRGAWERDEALARAQLATRRYAKRQYTWFRNQPPPDWPRATEPTPAQCLPLLLLL